MTEPPVTAREIAGMLAAVLAISAAIAGLTWWLLGFTSIDSDLRIFVATQTPVLVLLLFWLVVVLVRDVR